MVKCPKKILVPIYKGAKFFDHNMKLKGKKRGNL